jgi:hypothetical protein
MKRKPAKRERGATLTTAYAKLGVTPLDVALVPRIEHLFKGIGGKARVFEYLAGSETKEARAIMELRSLLNMEQSRVLPFEAFCVAAKVETKHMLGIISEEVFDQSRIASRLLRDAAVPSIVEATRRQAMTPAGTQEKRMMLTSGGVLPVNKTFVIPVAGDLNVDQRKQTLIQNAVLPPVESTVRGISDRFMQLAPPPPEEPENDEDDGQDEEEDE